MRRLVLFTLVSCVCLSALSNAQEFPLRQGSGTLVAARFSNPPKIDGSVGAREWGSVGSMARTLVIESTNQPSGERGQVWIGYDEEFLYIAARIILQDPGNISADEFRDNVSLRGNDRFSLELDTFGLTTDSSEISFNANGATRLEIAGGRAAKTEWSGRLEAAARITDTGWEGEARVPWRLLPLPSPGTHDMRFDVEWYVSATRRDVAFHSTQGDPTNLHTLSGVEVPKVSGGRSILLLPYGYAGIDDNDEHIADAGLDLKTSLTSDLFLVGTVNPDFRNIEGDILNLDFSNFERLADETRPFFQEGSGYYFFGHGRRLFASQRISSFDTGVNIYGNLGGSSRLGILSTIDYGNQAVTAGSYTYNPDPLTEFTGSFVSLLRAGEDNTGGRFAASRLFGKWMFFGESSVTDDEIIGTGTASTVGAFYATPGWRSNLFLLDVAGDFFPRVGFASETDFKGYSGSVTRELEFTSGTLTQAEIDFDFWDFERRGGAHYREGLSLDAELTLNNVLEVQVGTTYEHFLNRHDNLQSAKLEYPKNNPYRQIQVEYEFGEINNADYQSFSGRLRYRPVKRLQLSVRAQAVRHIVDEEQVIFGVNWEMDRYQSIGGRAVLQDDRWNWFASYRMSGNFGAEYFLIVGDPNASSFQRSLIFKVSVPLTIGG
ncbi:MAG: hypothetical protein IH945_09230 [Armatimonadetes bacterium]|nr:hypothetical protein [Armatimonadota bacterium]